MSFISTNYYEQEKQTDSGWLGGLLGSVGLGALTASIPVAGPFLAPAAATFGGGIGTWADAETTTETVADPWAARAQADERLRRKQEIDRLLWG